MPLASAERLIRIRGREPPASSDENRIPKHFKFVDIINICTLTIVGGLGGFHCHFMFGA